jgi:hypothetical protein
MRTASARCEAKIRIYSDAEMRARKGTTDSKDSTDADEEVDLAALSS